MTFIHNLAMFLLGVRDSVSLGWIRKLIFCNDSKGKAHPASLTIVKCLKSAMLQVGIFMFIIPLILNFLGIHIIAFLWRAIFLGLCYGYIFFYNEQILAAARTIILFRKQRLHEEHFDIDIVQNIPHFQYISGVIKGIIFLVFYYVPIMIITTILAELIPYFGMFTVIVSEAFFNAAFFFLSTWPYDKYNAGFLEKEKYYLLGFGMFVSIICNYFLSGFASLGVCLIISLWMLMNSVIYSPVEKEDGTEFTSFGEVWDVLTKSQERNKLKNAYNLHRRRLVENQNYGRELILNSAFLVNPALRITEHMNSWIGQRLTRVRQSRINTPSSQNSTNNPAPSTHQQ